MASQDRFYCTGYKIIAASLDYSRSTWIYLYLNATIISNAVLLFREIAMGIHILYGTVVLFSYYIIVSHQFII